MKATWISLILCLLVVACTESVFVEPNPQIQPKVELTISTSVEVLPFGEEVIVSWISQNSKYCVLNAETVQTIGSVKVKPFADTKYQIKAVNGSLSATAEKLIKVGDWTTSDLGLISYNYWLLKSYKYFQNGTVYNSALSDQDKINQYQFTVDGKCNFNGVFSSNWSFGTTGRIFVGLQDCSYSVTKNEFVRSMASQYNNQPAVFEVTYWRPEILIAGTIPAVP